MPSADQTSNLVDLARKDSEFSAVSENHKRRVSELSESVSDDEPYELSSRAAPLPAFPETSPTFHSYPRAGSPQSPPLESHSSYTEVNTDIEAQPKKPDYPEVTPVERSKGGRMSAPEHQESPDHTEKEAYFTPKAAYQTKFEEHQPSSQYDHVEKSVVDPKEERSRRKILGSSRKKFIIAVVILILVVIAIAVGVGVGVGTRKSKHSSSSDATSENNVYLQGGALNPAFYSKQGAFNGSGIALADVNFGLDNSLYVFYQKYSGEIEQLIYGADGTWNFVTQVATDAKNSTPLSTVAYIVDSVATWHLFYISANNTVKQRTSSNASDFQTNIWQDGPLTELELPVNDAETVGMQACYWGNYYGSLTDYNDAAFGASNATASTGMNIWFADTDTTFQQYDWTNGQDQWNHTQSWPNMNTHAGIGCQSWLTNTTSYVFMVDTNDTLNIYWKDIDTNKSSTSTHPINTYTRCPDIAIPNIHPLSSLGYTDFMIYQTKTDDTIHGANITWAAADTKIAPAKDSTRNAAESMSSSQDQWALLPQDAGIGGTHMAITGSSPVSGGRQELLFYQAVGDDLRLGKRDAAGGDFAFIEVPLGNLAKQH